MTAYNQLGTALEAAAEQMAEDTGVTVVIDPRNLVLPGVWLTPVSLTGVTLSGDARIVVRAHIIGQDVAPTAQLNNLGDIIDKMLASYGPPVNGQDILAESITLPSQGPEPMPGFGFDLSINIDA